MLHFQHFKKAYDSDPVIQIPELTLSKGIYWLQGENGAGKSTLLKSIAGLIPFSGTITVNGIDIRKQRQQYRKLVNWTDAEPLYPEFLTGKDLISFYQHTLTPNTTETKHLLQVLGVSNYMHQKVNTYSSGMLKKLSLVLAFMGQPKLILLDEPLITLDADAVNNCLLLIDEYSKGGSSFILSSHQSFIDTASFSAALISIKNKTIEVR